jgi:hypothetical protein
MPMSKVKLIEEMCVNKFLVILFIVHLPIIAYTFDWPGGHFEDWPSVCVDVAHSHRLDWFIKPAGKTIPLP